MVSKLPFLQFFPSDYMRDTRALSLAAKGAWMDILCMLHGSSTRGTVTLPMIGWARVMGASSEQADAVITEIETMNVADVVRNSNGDVTVTSRRMLREHITREQTRLRVQRHRGNAGCNASSNGVVADKKSEVRSQKSEKDIGSQAKPSSPTAEQLIAQAKDSPAYQGIDVEREWHKMVQWCERNHKKASAKRYTNWLNRVEAPINNTAPANGVATPAHQNGKEWVAQAKGIEKSLLGPFPLENGKRKLIRGLVFMGGNQARTWLIENGLPSEQLEEIMDE